MKPTTPVQKPKASEDEVLLAITDAINLVSKDKFISQLTMLGVLSALRVEQEHLFWETQLRFREQNAQKPADKIETVAFKETPKKVVGKKVKK